MAHDGKSLQLFRNLNSKYRAKYFCIQPKLRDFDRALRRAVYCGFLQKPISGITLIIGQLIHAKGINVPPPDFSKRVLGMKLTFGTLISLAVLNLGWTLY